MENKTLTEAVGAYLAVSKTKKADLADALGISVTTLNRKVEGKPDGISLEEAFNLSRKLGCTTDEIYSLMA